MIKNLEQWKNELIKDYDVTIHGHEDDNIYEEISNRFLSKIYALDYQATEAEADVLFSLFTDEEDYEVLESVLSQLDSMRDQKVFVKCLLKAFPRLINEAKNWATTFLCIMQRDDVLKLVKKSEDNTGKQSVIDYINQYISNAKPSQRELTNAYAMKHYLTDLENFKQLAKEIEASMK